MLSVMVPQHRKQLTVSGCILITHAKQMVLVCVPARVVWNRETPVTLMPTMVKIAERRITPKDRTMAIACNGSTRHSLRALRTSVAWMTTAEPLVQKVIQCARGMKKSVLRSIHIVLELGKMAASIADGWTKTSRSTAPPTDDSPKRPTRGFRVTWWHNRRRSQTSEMCSSWTSMATTSWTFSCTRPHRLQALALRDATPLVGLDLTALRCHLSRCCTARKTKVTTTNPCHIVCVVRTTAS